MNTSDQIVTTLPSVQEMVKNGYSTKHWLQYYINIWNRQSVAAAIDIKTDQIRKAIDPEMEVEEGHQVVPVKVRLENRKLKLQDYLDIISAAKTLMALPDDQIEEALFGEKALAVDEDMLPKPEEKPEEPKPENIKEVAEVVEGGEAEEGKTE